MQYDPGTIRNSTWHWTGPLPVPMADIADAVGDGATRIRFAMPVTIDDMIACIGTEGWEEYIDDRAGILLGSSEVEIDPDATAALPRREAAYTVVVTVTADIDPEEIDLGSEVSDIAVRFRPETWHDDTAVPATPTGPTVWFVSNRTADVIESQRRRRPVLRLDFVQGDAFAPAWVRDWAGPFTIELVPTR